MPAGRPRTSQRDDMVSVTFRLPAPLLSRFDIATIRQGHRIRWKMLEQLLDAYESKKLVEVKGGSANQS